MENRVAVLAIIVRNGDAVAELNALLHQYGEHIIGRMGLPCRERGLVQITQGEDGFLTLRLSRPAGKVDLFACPYLRRLKSPNPNGRE